MHDFNENSEQPSNETDSQINTESEKPPEDRTEEEFQDKIEELEEELAQKKNTIQDLRDKLQRLQADFENYKKRQKKEVKEQVRRAEDNVISQFIPIYDNLVRAFKSFKKNNDHDSFIEGTERIYAQFDELLKKEDVRPIPAEGERFDPKIHEALMKVESSENENNEVTEEFERGYFREDRVIRPSKVKVNIKPESETEQESETDEN